MTGRLRIAAALSAAAFFWLGARQLRARAIDERAGWPATADRLTLPPPGTARALSLGYRELFADVVWTRALVYYGSSWGGDGDLSQVEQLADLIIDLDPRFEPAYLWATYAVLYRTGEVTQAEYRSSVHYLELAMERFPDNYKHFWTAGTRYYLNLQSDDPHVTRFFRERGAQLIEQAMEKPNAPTELATIAATMRSKLGQHERALDTLRHMIAMTDDDAARKQLLARLRKESPDVADELAAARRALEESWQRDMPAVSLDFYILLGPPPSPTFDLRELTTPRNLFGTDAAFPQ
jgi:tetratricopeptide (TPR) repeat protein